MNLRRFLPWFTPRVSEPSPGFEPDFDETNFDLVVFAWTKRRIDRQTTEEQEEIWHKCMQVTYHSQRGANN